ncbi:MAG: DUF885 domain-containing protein [Actinomycetota bacterium]|nr:DUF885 domain-containing protein [Actinomycetota bacterium]
MLPGTDPGAGTVERYMVLGLAVGRHIPGFVDAYYGPEELALRASAGSPLAPEALVAEARSLLASIDAGEALGDPVARTGESAEAEGLSAADAATRRRWLRAQVVGVLTSARILAGEAIGYADEVESCYGVRPRRPLEQDVLDAHRELDEVVPGRGALEERYVAWRESQAVPPELLDRAIRSLAEDLRERTSAMFGLPDGERVEWVLARDEPWSGFNYYLGDLASRVAVNVDLPVLSTSLAHLVAHEAYPGHHTEHTRKEAGLVRSRHWWEESLFLVGTPQCLVAEGLADLGLEVAMGERPERAIAAHLVPLGVAYDADTVAVVSAAAERLSSVRALAAFRLHEDHADPELVADEVARLALLPAARARKTVDFLRDPTWRSYISCYTEGLPLCRAYVGGRPERFARLVTEQCVPSDLARP